MAGFGTILDKPIHDRYRGPHREHAPGAAARVQGLARGRRRARRGREGHRLHRALRHARGRRRPDPRPGSGAGPATTTPWRRCTSASRTSSAGSTRRCSWQLVPTSRKRSASLMRALLSVYDKTGLVEFATGLSRARRRARVERRHGPGARRGRPAGHDGRGRHRLARDARPPGGDAAPEDPRRDPRRPRQGVAPRRPRGARHHAVRPRRLEPLPVRERPGHRDDRHRRPDDGARRGEEPRVGRDRHRAPTQYDAVLDELRATTARCRTRPGARSRSRRSRSTAAYDAAIVEWLSARRATTRCCRSTSCSRSSRPTRRCATARTRTSTARATGCAARRAGGTASPSTAASRSATSTTTTPTPRGSSCTTSVTGPAVAIIKHANPCGVAIADDLATAYQLALECDERSAFGGIVALNRPIDDATVGADGRRPAGRRGDRARLRAAARSTR